MNLMKLEAILKLGSNNSLIILTKRIKYLLYLQISYSNYLKTSL